MICIDGHEVTLDEACLAGIRHYEKREFERAVAIFNLVIKADPCHPRALNALAIMASERDEDELSLVYLDRLLTAHSSFEKGYNTRGSVLLKLGRADEAEADFTTAISLNPSFVEAYGSLGEVYLRQKRWDQALDCFRRIIALRPHSARAFCGAGVALQGKGIHGDALASFRKAAELASQFEADSAAVNAYLGSVLLVIGSVDEAIEALGKAITRNPADAAAHSNLLLAMHYSDRYSPAGILDESRRWDSLHAYQPIPVRRQVKRSQIRVGYVSSDFRDHVVTFFFEPLLAAHDRSNFCVYCYSDVVVPDPTTFRLQNLTDHWVNTAGLSDKAFAERVSADEIDILVDLKGHTSKNRMKLFTLKSAPVQVAWLGYPGTTGLRSMDYRITDGIADPEGMTEAFHAEQLIRLPHCFLCYRPPADSPAITLLPALKGKGVTFGCFNDLAKVTPTVLATWGKLLKAVPDSRLLIKSKWFEDGQNRRYVVEALEAEDIDPTRIHLLGFARSGWDHLACYHDIDIALDTFPYNGTTTTFEALWMGVPVITLAGGNHVARVGASILSNIGLSDFIAQSVNDYIAIARGIAHDLDLLNQTRQTLREHLCTSILCNEAAFAHSMEDAYGTMHLSARSRN